MTEPLRSNLEIYRGSNVTKIISKSSSILLVCGYFRDKIDWGESSDTEKLCMVYDVPYQVLSI